MANKMLGKVVAGAALGGASLLVFAPGIAFADGHHDGESRDGKVYAKPHVVKAGEKVELLEVCSERQEHAFVWSKVTGKVKLRAAEKDHGQPGEEHGKPGEEHGKPGEEHGKPGEEHGKPGEEQGKDEGKPGEEHGKPGEEQGKDQGKPGEEHGKPGEEQGKDEGKPGEEHGKPGEEQGKDQGKPGEEQGGKGGGAAADSYGEDDWGGYQHDQKAEKDHGKESEKDHGKEYGKDHGKEYGKDHGKEYGKDSGYGKDSEHGKDSGYGKDSEHGKDSGYGNDSEYGKDSGYGNDSGKGEDERSWEHKKDFVYFGEAEVAEDAEPGRYELHGSCGEGELVVLPRGHVEGGDGGATTGTDRGMATTGAGMLGAAALGGIVLIRRRRANGSLV